jgi:hypothetical protein
MSNPRGSIKTKAKSKTAKRLETPLLDEMREDYRTLAHEWASLHNLDFLAGKQKLNEIWPFEIILIESPTKLMYMGDAQRNAFLKAAAATEKKLEKSIEDAHDELDRLQEELLGEGGFEYEEGEEEDLGRSEQEEDETDESDEDEDDDDSFIEEEEEIIVQPQPRKSIKTRR